MNATLRRRPGPNDRKQGCLGDLLDFGPTAGLPLEADWAALVRSMAAGDQLALRELYRRTHRLVFTLTMRITRDRQTAEELTVDVFHEAWRRAESYDAANGTVIGWVMNLARSRAIDRLRFEQRKKRVDPRPGEPLAAACANHAAACANGADEALVSADRDVQLRNALATLSADERKAIETTYFLGLTHAEAAARLGEPLGTVKTRIRSGLAKLRCAFGAQTASP